MLLGLRLLHGVGGLPFDRVLPVTFVSLLVYHWKSTRFTLRMCSFSGPNSVSAVK
jgi:hypothetical protein